MITLEEAKRQLRLPTSFTAQDDEIRGFIADAAAWVERYTGHVVTPRDVTETFRVPGRTVRLDAWPVASNAAVSVSYPGALGSPIAVLGSTLDVGRGPAKLTAPGGLAWPLTDADQALTVTFRAGYEDATQLPGDFRRAMLMLVTAYNEDRTGGDVLRKAEETAGRMCWWARRVLV